MLGSDGVKYIRYPIHTRNFARYQIATNKHGGGNVMVWGCFGMTGIRSLHHMDVSLSKKYMEMLGAICS